MHVLFHQQEAIAPDDSLCYPLSSCQQQLAYNFPEQPQQQSLKPKGDICL